jgi:hypothetical protein
MSDYLIEFEGKYDLQQINLQISAEEAGASEFISSSISFNEGRITNLVKFKDLATGTFPKKLTLVKHGQTQPDGTVHVWSGAMIVDNNNEAVSAYRAT